jgi:hypothetical protein
VRPRIERSDWSLSGGLPVCTIEKIVDDLLADREDESAVAQVVRDGIRDGLLGRDELERVAARYGVDYGYGSATEFRAPDMVFIASSLSAGWPACLSLAGVVFVPAVRYK